ncbi:MAG: endo-1,4-beta-xylanase, partial [bacterium]|nr:endo-1,4-beta-xylanase [bacterium]
MRPGLGRRGAAIALLTVAIVLLSGMTGRPPTGNLLTSEDWQQFAGATTTKGGLRIESLGRSIIHQDGSRGQPNPPVNLAGPHLALSGDFRLTARMEGVDSTATIRLYGQPPVVYDQWRFETPSVSIDVSTSTVVARIWDGSSSTSVDERTYPFISNGAVALSVEYRGDVLVVNLDNRELGSIPAHHIFDSKEVWFGLDAAVGSAWTLSALSVDGHVEIIPPPAFQVPHDVPNALRTLAAAHPRKLRVGAAISFGSLVTDEEYRKIALGEFNMMTPENGMKPQFIHPQPDVYSFTEMDTLVGIALSNGMLVHGHTLVYARSNPEWMTKAPKVTREKIMLEHIATVAGHFKGKVAEW